MADWGGAFGYFGSAAQDLFSAQGEGMAAGGFDAAAAAEDTSAKIAAGSTRIQQSAAERSIERAVGGQQADVSGAGFEFSGSAMDMMRDTVQQGAITHALIENQGAIEVRSHKIAATNYRQQAAQARQKQGADSFGGFLSIGLGVLSLFSDRRLKHSVVFKGKDPDGLNIYEFSYLGSTERWRGYIAQELPGSDVTDAAGVLGVGEKYRAERVS